MRRSSRRYPMSAIALTALLSVCAIIFAGRPDVDRGADAASGSLPSVPSGARPGPDVLYAPAPAAPQLENRHPRFDAEPLLVSGHEAYVLGEYIYQDHIYDDYGSDTNGSGA